MVSNLKMQRPFPTFAEARTLLLLEEIDIHDVQVRRQPSCGRYAGAARGTVAAPTDCPHRIRRWFRGIWQRQPQSASRTRGQRQQRREQGHQQLLQGPHGPLQSSSRCSARLEPLVGHRPIVAARLRWPSWSHAASSNRVVRPAVPSGASHDAVLGGILPGTAPWLQVRWRGSCTGPLLGFFQLQVAAVRVVDPDGRRVLGSVVPRQQLQHYDPDAAQHH
jgi:hypothetical protein